MWPWTGTVSNLPIFLTAPSTDSPIDYSIFSQEQARWNNTYRLQQTCQLKNELVASNQHHWTMMAEFCVADTDCAGSKTVVPNAGGSFYDGTQPGSQRVGSCVGKTGTAADFSTAQKQFMRQYFEAQTAAAEAASGWIYWTWKSASREFSAEQRAYVIAAETAHEWSYYYGVQVGRFRAQTIRSADCERTGRLDTPESNPADLS